MRCTLRWMHCRMTRHGAQMSLDDVLNALEDVSACEDILIIDKPGDISLKTLYMPHGKCSLLVMPGWNVPASYLPSEGPACTNGTAHQGNGEEVCEMHGYSESECLAIGCCQWDPTTDNGAGACWSAVGRDPCTADSTTGTYGGFGPEGPTSYRRLLQVQRQRNTKSKVSCLPLHCCHCHHSLVVRCLLEGPLTLGCMCVGGWTDSAMLV